MPRDRSNSPPPPLDGFAPGDVANQVRTAPAGDLAGNGLAIQVTAYSTSGSTCVSPLVSYSTTSYFPAGAPVSRTPSTESDVEPRGVSASSSSFGDAASDASASESSFILTADPPLLRAQGGKNSLLRPQGVYARLEPRRRPSTYQFRNFAGHGQHAFAAIKLKTQDPSTLLGLAMHVVCSAELADGQRGMGSEGKRLIRVYQ